MPAYAAVLIAAALLSPVGPPPEAVETPARAVVTVLEPTLTGTATWYGTGPGRGHAAAGPGLRRLLGPDWRGSTVAVSHGGSTIRVRVTDWCLCRDDRVIDLSDEDFARLAPLSRGVIEVRIR